MSTSSVDAVSAELALARHKVAALEASLRTAKILEDKHPLVLAYERAAREYRRVQAGPEPIESRPRAVWQNAVAAAFMDMDRAAKACYDANLPIETLDPDLR